MKPQNSTPTTPSTANRTLRPRSPAIVRARAVRYLGVRIQSSGASGFSTVAGAAERCVTLTRAPPPSAVVLRIEHIHQVSRRVLAGQLQEDLLQPAAAVRRRPAQLGHRAECVHPAVHDDADAVA